MARQDRHCGRPAALRAIHGFLQLSTFTLIEAYIHFEKGLITDEGESRTHGYRRFLRNYMADCLASYAVLHGLPRNVGTRLTRTSDLTDTEMRHGAGTLGRRKEAHWRLPCYNSIDESELRILERLGAALLDDWTNCHGLASKRVRRARDARAGLAITRM